MDLGGHGHFEADPAALVQPADRLALDYTGADCVADHYDILAGQSRRSGRHRACQKWAGCGHGSSDDHYTTTGFRNGCPSNPQGRSSRWTGQGGQNHWTTSGYGHCGRSRDGCLDTSRDPHRWKHHTMCNVADSRKLPKSRRAQHLQREDNLMPARPASYRRRAQNPLQPRLFAAGQKGQARRRPR